MDERFWPGDGVAAFRYSRAQYGKLSNMTGGFPLQVGSATFSGTEALYQALKFPEDAGAQRAIAAASNGMEAKRAAYMPRYRSSLRPDWDDARVGAMRIALCMKLDQHYFAFCDALLETSGLRIMENSSRDSFWGAKPYGSGYRGVNMLGLLLMELRELIRENDDFAFGRTPFLSFVNLSGFVLLGEELTQSDAMRPTP